MKAGTKLSQNCKFPGVPKGTEWVLTHVQQAHYVNMEFQPAIIHGMTCHEQNIAGELRKVGFQMQGNTIQELAAEVLADFIVIDRDKCSFAPRYKVKKAPKCGCRQCQYLWNTKRGVDLTPAF